MILNPRLPRFLGAPHALINCAYREGLEPRLLFEACVPKIEFQQGTNNHCEHNSSEASQSPISNFRAYVHCMCMPTLDSACNPWMYILTITVWKNFKSALTSRCALDNKSEYRLTHPGLTQPYTFVLCAILIFRSSPYAYFSTYPDWCVLKAALEWIRSTLSMLWWFLYLFPVTFLTIGSPTVQPTLLTHFLWNFGLYFWTAVVFSRV